MKTNKNYILREIVDEYMLIPTGEASVILNGMIHLTETAAFIWRQVDVAENLQEIVSALIIEYDIDEATAKEDVYGFLMELYIREMVTDIPEIEKKLSIKFGEK